MLVRIKKKIKATKEDIRRIKTKGNIIDMWSCSALRWFIEDILIISVPLDEIKP